MGSLESAVLEVLWDSEAALKPAEVLDRLGDDAFLEVTQPAAFFLGRLFDRGQQQRV